MIALPYLALNAPRLNAMRCSALIGCAQGVRFCCAVDCDSGTVEVSTEDGEVTCRCYH